MNSRIRLCVLLLVLLKMIDVAHAAASAHSSTEVDSARLKNALTMLDKTETGKAALEKVKELEIPIKSSAVSKTEIIATRTMSGSEEKLSYQVQVLVARDKDPVFQALDLAHELVHATHPKKNPFDPNLSASEYVRHGIEGDGGEAQAIAQECKVGQEIIDSKEMKTQISNETVQLIKARCQFVWNTQDNATKWKQSFYQMGQHFREFASVGRGMDIQNLKVVAKSPIFSSAVAHKPYPLALLEEYIDITKRICEKNRRVASVEVTAFDQRCHSVGQ